MRKIDRKNATMRKLYKFILNDIRQTKVRRFEVSKIMRERRKNSLGERGRDTENERERERERESEL